MAANGHGDADAWPPRNVRPRLERDGARNGGLADDREIQHAPQLAGVAGVGNPIWHDDAVKHLVEEA
eukprot:3231340-Pyramimonas_sp.AAC.1